MKSEIKIERKGFELDTFNIFKVFYGSDQVEVEYIVSIADDFYHPCGSFYHSLQTILPVVAE